MLQEWSSIKTPAFIYPPTPASSCFHRSTAALGGLEGICSAMVLSALDEDGDGRLTAAEKEHGEKRARELIDATLNFCVNLGVVSALLLSMTFPLSFEPLVLDSDSPWSANVQNSLELMYVISLQLTLGCSLASIFMCSRMYVHLSFWMPTHVSQIWYIREKKKSMLMLSILQMTMTISCGVCILFGSLCVLSWRGLLSLIPLLASLAVLVCWDIPTAASCLRYQHKTAKDIFGHQEVITEQLSC